MTGEGASPARWLQLDYHVSCFLRPRASAIAREAQGGGGEDEEYGRGAKPLVTGGSWSLAMQLAMSSREEKDARRRQREWRQSLMKLPWGGGESPAGDRCVGEELAVGCELVQHLSEIQEEAADYEEERRRR
eukprot:757593-Hanusia_phi.AAC.4